MKPKRTCQIEGSLITYNSSDRKDITKINYYLFGRISTIRKNNFKEQYYYPGLLENIPFKKLTNGCYFIPVEKFDGQVSEAFSSLLKIHPAIIGFDNDNMQTSHDIWKDKVNGDTRNWVVK